MAYRSALVAVETANQIRDPCLVVVVLRNSVRRHFAHEEGKERLPMLTNTPEIELCFRCRSGQCDFGGGRILADEFLRMASSRRRA
jgi:hypothetical protein